MTMRDLGLTYEDAQHRLLLALKRVQGERVADLDTYVALLRTGIEARANDLRGLANLLIAKGIITEAEYLEQLRLAMNQGLTAFEDYLRS